MSLFFHDVLCSPSIDSNMSYQSDGGRLYNKQGRKGEEKRKLPERGIAMEQIRRKEEKRTKEQRRMKEEVRRTKEQRKRISLHRVSVCRARSQD